MHHRGGENVPLKARASPRVPSGSLQVAPESLRKIGKARVPGSIGNASEVHDVVGVRRVVRIRDLARPALTLIVASVVGAADKAILALLIRLAMPAHLLD